MQGINRLTPFLNKLHFYANPALNTSENRELLSRRIEKIGEMDLSSEERHTFSTILKTFDSLGEMQSKEVLDSASHKNRQIKFVTKNDFPIAGKVPDLFFKNEIISVSNDFSRQVDSPEELVEEALCDVENFGDSLVFKNERWLGKGPFFSSIPSNLGIILTKEIAKKDEIFIGDHTYNIHYLMVAYLGLSKPIDPFTKTELKEEEKIQICELYGITISDFEDLWKEEGMVDTQFKIWECLSTKTAMKMNVIKDKKNEKEEKWDIKKRIRTMRFIFLVEKAKGSESGEYKSILDILDQRRQNLDHD